MAKKSQTLKEILQIVIFLIVVGVLLTSFVIYPLNRTRAIMGRADIDSYNADSLPPNDPSLFIEAGLKVDTFLMEPDALTSLACLYIEPVKDANDSVRGTVFLLHDERHDRASMIPLARLMSDSGYAVVVYDQRASGLSGAKYHGDGQLEAGDLQELIAHLEIRGRAIRPISVVGESIGAEAALLASREESRIDRVVAISPFLSTTRMIDIYRTEFDTYWLPFFRTLFWWWYDIRSGYAASYRSADDIRPVGCPTFLLVTSEDLDDPEIQKLINLSDPDKLSTSELPQSETVLLEYVTRFLFEQGEADSP
jgi:hypothetical protein